MTVALVVSNELIFVAYSMQLTQQDGSTEDASLAGEPS